MVNQLAPKTMADGNTRVAYVPTLANPAKPTVSELTGGTDLSCRVLKSDFRASAVASETINGMAALCETSNASAPGQSNYEVSFSVFRWFDPENPGKKDPAGDVAFQALKVKGTHGFIVKRETGKAYEDPWVEGDEVEVYEIVTDTPQAPTEAGGYIRRLIPTFPQNGWTDAVVAAS